MKNIGILLVGIYLVACTPMPTLEQLEDRANLTGDWTQVEKREQAIQRRQVRHGLNCPAGRISYCEQRMHITECACVRRTAIRDILGNSW